MPPKKSQKEKGKEKEPGKEKEKDPDKEKGLFAYKFKPITVGCDSSFEDVRTTVLIPRDRQNLATKALERDLRSKGIDEGFDGKNYFGFKVTDLRKKKDKAFLGYLTMDVVDPPDGAFWGKFNNRAIDQNWIKLLSDTFEKNLDNCLSQTAMDVAIDPKWLVDPSVMLRSVEGLGIDEVPAIDFNEQGSLAIKGKNLWILGGNHRRIALKSYRDRMKEEIEKMNRAIKKVTDDMPETDAIVIEPEQKEHLKKVKDRVKALGTKLDSSSMWVIRLYDRGTSRETIRSPSVSRTRILSSSTNREREQTGVVQGLVQIHF
jgi:hypothetical protein